MQKAIIDSSIPVNGSIFLFLSTAVSEMKNNITKTHMNLSGEISGSIGNGNLPHLLNMAKRNQSNNALDKLFFMKITAKGATARKPYRIISCLGGIWF